MPNQPAKDLEPIYMRIPRDLKQRLMAAAAALDEREPEEKHSASSITRTALEKELARIERALEK